jgi:HSP20 family protein
MVSWDMFGELDTMRNEVDEVFRSAGYIRPTATNFLAPLSTRRIPFRVFSGDERKIYLSRE